ncbi:magnesium transporter [Gymnodinialimonas sp. 57CJ19]|uniref:magnesium transporter n=1 Tax=Gymnodinialimonas sp. 57CJ19 TaxID=3138498 RepID=UPI0031342DED
MSTEDQGHRANTVPDATSTDDTTRFLRTAHPVDVAAWIGHLSTVEALAQLQALEPTRSAAVFSAIEPSRQVALADAMSEDELARIGAGMDADDRVDLFNLLPPTRQQRLIRDISDADQAALHRLAVHGEHAAGALMTSDFATLDADMTATQALTALRDQAAAAETIYRSYVLDADGRLVGAVRLHALVMAEDASTVRDIMEHHPIAVTSETRREEVAHLIARYDLLAIPVVDAHGALVGIVTHDDATDAMQAEMTEDFQKISTVLPFSQNMREASIRVLYSKRIVWLALLVFGNLFSGAGIAYFEETILAYVSLVFFLPLLIDSSGNAGAQSATLMVRAMATGDVVLKDWRDLIVRELSIAAALGATMALVVVPLGIWRGGSDVAFVVGLTMFFVVIIGSLVGMSLPFLLSRLKLDPATASGPLVTTISDGVGVLIYFSIATLVLTL